MNSVDKILDDIIGLLRHLNEQSAASTVIKSLEKHATSIEQYDQLARLAFENKDYALSAHCAAKSLALAQTQSEEAAARTNLAKVYNLLNEPLLSLEHTDWLLKNIGNTNYDILIERALSFYFLGEYKSARTILSDLFANPDVPASVKWRCEYNYGSLLLDNNQFREGLHRFVNIGHDLGIWPAPGTKLPKPQWDGTPKPGATVVILAEGGIGDEVINVRFVNHIRRLGMNPVFIPNSRDTYNLFANNNLPVLTNINQAPQDAEYILSMYLPLTLKLDPEDLWEGPYLKPLPHLIDKWKKILPEGRKVAIRWQGNPQYEQDLHRSIPLAELDRVLDFSREDITFVSVQKDNYEGVENYPVLHVAEHLETLDDLLACLSLMDYTVSSCTSTAHIAAAAGFPITVCPPIATYYIWLGDSKWYGDHCKIARQTKWRDYSHLDLIKTHYEHLCIRPNNNY